MNPMRALMQIPLREPPKLSDPAAWSPSFHEFLALCLNREPRKRATIDQLLEHSFVQVLLLFVCSSIAFLTFVFVVELSFQGSACGFDKGGARGARTRFGC